MKLSVLISTYNRRDVLSRSLPTILDQDLPVEEYEIVVVVDGSTDGTVEMLRGLKSRCAFRVLEQPNRGLAAARNAGWKAAIGDLILFLDDDILCDRALLREHATAHRGSRPEVVFGPVWLAHNSPNSSASDWYKARSETSLDSITRERKLRWPDDFTIAANCSVPRSTLFESGGFDEQFGCREEQDLGLRFWKMGVNFRYQPRAVAYQLYVKSPRELVVVSAKRAGSNEVLLCRKHPAYRPYSPLSGLIGEFSPRNLARQFAARLPVSPEPLLRPPFWLAEQLRWMSVTQRAAMFLLKTRTSIVYLRSALQEARSWESFRRVLGMKLPVLLYHNVGPPRPRTLPQLTISPKQFEKQVRRLARMGYAGIRPSDWLRWCHEGTPLPDKPILLTFDDAYADLADYALPLLRQYGFGAAVFVVTRQVGGTNVWDEQRGIGTLRLMTAEQIRHWAAQGIEFGAHSRTHTDLTKLSGDELKGEIIGSRDDLANLLGLRIVSFAYPYGYYDQTVLDCVRRAFDLAFSADEGPNTLRTDPHLLRRTMVKHKDSLADLEYRARWGWNPMEQFRARVRLRSRVRAVASFVFGRSGS